MSNTARSIDFVLMRGGTSKAVFLRSHDVPEDRDRLASLLLDIFGSPDRRQIDGLGGADKLTSKAAIVGTPIKADSDVYYLFGQVGILKPQVDFKLNCGNISAAVAAYAVEEGLVAAAEGSTCVRIHSVNTDRIIVAHVPTSNGRLVERGELLLSVALHVAAWFLTIEDYSWTLGHPAWDRKLILLKI
jgi:2-methylaconitate cis-trans-isomerase PrpF